MLPRTEKQYKTTTVPSAAPKRWLPPAIGIAKINVDGAVLRYGRGGVAAAICHDHSGAYLGSSVVVFQGMTDPTILETYACREATALAEDLNLQDLCVASDCQGVVKDILMETSGANAAIVHEVIERKGSFRTCSFVFEHWNFNFEVHNLAKYACNLSLD